MRQSVKSAILVHVLKNEHKINGGNTVKFIRQFLIIILISFAGELLHAILPLPVPASIYGLLILLAGLQTKVIPLKAVDEAGGFLIEIMPMLFIPAGVGLMGRLKTGSCSDHGYNCSDNSAGYGREWKNRSVCTEERGEEG